MPRSASKASLLVVFLTVVVDLLGFGLVLPLIPVYAKELMTGYSDAQRAWTLGLLMTCYSIMQLVFAPLWGRVSDRVGRRKTLVLASLCIFLGTLTYSQSHNFWQFLVAEVFFAAGLSSMSGTDSALIYDSLKQLGREDEYQKIVFPGCTAIFKYFWL